jgi:hypothetical protein
MTDEQLEDMKALSELLSKEANDKTTEIGGNVRGEHRAAHDLHLKAADLLLNVEGPDSVMAAAHIETSRRHLFVSKHPEYFERGRGREEQVITAGDVGELKL